MRKFNKETQKTLRKKGDVKETNMNYNKNYVLTTTEAMKNHWKMDLEFSILD
jgi:hypothetical protein